VDRQLKLVTKPKGNKSHNLTPEERARSHDAPRTIWHSLAISLRNRKTCSTKCTFFESCPVSGMSMGYRNKVNPAEDQKCLMREFPENVRRQFIDLFLTGEEGFIRGIKTAMNGYMNDVNTYGNLRDKRDMVQLLIQLYKEIYSTRRSGTTQKEPLQITIRRVSGGVEENETIDVTPRTALPAGSSTRDIFSPQSRDETESDPESLMNSPMLEKIARPVDIHHRPDHPKKRLLFEEITVETNMKEIMDE
jgi:hypothetical protein